MGYKDTSYQAYKSLKRLGDKQSLVYGVIKDCGPVSNLDIAKRTGWEINRVTPRCNELVELGMVVESHRAVHPITGKRVIYWKVNPTPKPTIKDQCDELIRGVESFQMSLKGIPDFNQSELDF